MLVNGRMSGGRTGTGVYSIYVNPYTVIGNGKQMSKHFYIGSQRIASQLCSSGQSSTNPLTTDKATKAGAVTLVNYPTKYANLTSKVKTRYDSLNVPYKGTDNNGAGFWTSTTIENEPDQYYYHSDHLGSSSLITNLAGTLVQHLEYVPFSEVFLDERTTTYDTPFKFNAKELDEETGLYYYGARYYDPRTSLWLSVDPLAEKYPGVSSFVYCLNNPVKFVDPDGMRIVFTVGKQEYLFTGKGLIDPQTGKQVSVPKNSQMNRVVNAYIKAFNCNDKDISKAVKTLISSSKDHKIQGEAGSRNAVMGGDRSTRTEDREVIMKGEGVGTNTTFDFSAESRSNFYEKNGIEATDFTTVVHEVQHQLDYDQGNMADSHQQESSSKNPAEIRAIKLENKARAVEGLKGLRTKYDGQKIDPKKLN